MGQENNFLHSKLKVQRLKVLVMLLQKQKHALKLLRLKEKLLFNKQNFVLKQARLNLKLNLNKQPNDNKLKSPINKNLTNWNFQAQKLAEIEAAKFAEIVETIQQIARAGPEMQAKLLGGLGLKGIMITDGNSPINMFNTAKGLIGEGMSTQ